jgi:hypothetical protein
MIKLGDIQFILIKEYKDGSADYDLIYDEEFKKTVKEVFGLKRLRKERIRKIIFKGIDNLIEKYKKEGKL